MTTDTTEEHEHVWVFQYEHDDWYDGDSYEVYRCSVCNKRAERYFPR